ncbi:MAG: AcrR family transcriptional regulator [Bacteriovoracaceae bacterium]|jgi:AcrR family transcriptional regulator
MAEIKKEVWLKMGLKVLDKGGLNELKVSNLCNELSVTKGSFYHWFKSKSDFDMALLAYWRELFTENFIQSAEVGTNSNDKLSRLVNNCIEGLQSGSRLELEINIWAHKDLLVKNFVNEVYINRFNYLVKLLEDIHSNKNEAKRHALTLYSLTIGADLFYKKLTRKELEMIFQNYL